jgi:hypothetical protein
MSKITFADMLTGADPETRAFFAPEIAKKAAKRAIHRGTAPRKPRPSTGNPVGRQMLGLDELIAAQAKRRLGQAAWIAAKRAKAQLRHCESTENIGGCAKATGP